MTFVSVNTELLLIHNFFLWHIKRRKKEMIVWSFLCSSSFHPPKWETNVDDFYGCRRSWKDAIKQQNELSIKRSLLFRSNLWKCNEANSAALFSCHPTMSGMCVAFNVSPLFRISRGRLGWGFTHLHHKPLNAKERRRQIPMSANKQRAESDLWFHSSEAIPPTHCRLISLIYLCFRQNKCLAAFTLMKDFFASQNFSRHK